MATIKQTTLLIIGAGPFGLALSAHAKRLGINHIIVGKPMEFWKNNMPAGMLLRSTCDWHLDTADECTLDAFLQTRGQICADVLPLTIEFYLDYINWFIQQKQLDILPHYVTRLDENGGHSFTVITDGDVIIHARYVVSAAGLTYFKHLPSEITARLPQGSYKHTADVVNMGQLKNKRVLIIGGRQSAFEWAALLNEAGAEQVHISHRHPTPAFTTSDWSWVNTLCNNLIDDPLWYRNLPQEDKDKLGQRFWQEGRLKLEPWLKARLQKGNISIWPCTAIISAESLADGGLRVMLSSNEAIVVDEIILATGYKVTIDDVPFLKEGNILHRLAVADGFPVLDEYFQTNIPGLFITGMAAARYFGPFFGFTISVRTSAKLMGKALMKAVNSNENNK